MPSEWVVESDGAVIWEVEDTGSPVDFVISDVINYPSSPNGFINVRAETNNYVFTRSDGSEVSVPRSTMAAAGNSFLFGDGVPHGSLGINGDIYFRRITGAIYKKVGGVWVNEKDLATQSEITTIQGTLQAMINALTLRVSALELLEDAELLYGSGVPSNTLGNNGDGYLDVTNGKIYKKIANSWTEQSDIATQAELNTISNLLTSLAVRVVALEDIEHITQQEKRSLSQVVKKVSDITVTTEPVWVDSTNIHFAIMPITDLTNIARLSSNQAPTGLTWQLANTDVTGSGIVILRVPVSESLVNNRLKVGVDYEILDGIGILAQDANYVYMGTLAHEINFGAGTDVRVQNHGVIYHTTFHGALDTKRIAEKLPDALTTDSSLIMEPVNVGGALSSQRLKIHPELQIFNIFCIPAYFEVDNIPDRIDVFIHALANAFPAGSYGQFFLRGNPSPATRLNTTLITNQLTMYPNDIQKAAIQSNLPTHRTVELQVKIYDRNPTVGGQQVLLATYIVSIGVLPARSGGGGFSSYNRSLVLTFTRAFVAGTPSAGQTKVNTWVSTGWTIPATGIFELIFVDPLANAQSAIAVSAVSSQFQPLILTAESLRDTVQISNAHIPFKTAGRVIFLGTTLARQDRGFILARDNANVLQMAANQERVDAIPFRIYHLR